MRIRLIPNTLYRVCEDLGGVSRDELSRRLGVATVTAWRIDAGKSDPSPKFIAALMKLTGEKFETLFELQDAA